MAAYNASEGKQEELGKVQFLIAKLDSPEIQEESDEFKFTSQDLEHLIQIAYLTPGLRWRLPSLNRYLGSLRKGDFGFVFARPETGKTTFLCSEASHMALQSTDKGAVIHINNEEQEEKVMLRYYQAALGCTLEQLHSNIKEAQKKFEEVTKGNLILWCPGTVQKNQVEKLHARYKPSLVIYDQIDKIQGFDSDREDLRLGTIYQWARELSKSYCPAIGVCQADGTGEGQRWLTMANVANAKTSKQAEADWILGIGKVPDSGYEKLRFFHLSKNKLFGDQDTDHSQRHGKWEVLIDAERARYKDIK